MLFSSIIFIFLFLPIFLSAYFVIKKEYRNLFILLASLLFYFWGEGEYVLVLILYMIANYFFGVLIEKFAIQTYDRARLYAKITLILGLVFNIGFLVFFKYFNFIVVTINSAFEKISSFQLVNPEIHLPIGISFFTFQAISYIVDVYRGDVLAQKNFINFSMYKTLFPQLIAGPIIRYKDISKQILNRACTYSSFSIGISRFILGLAKKVLIADILGSVVKNIFSLPANEMSFGAAWLGVVCFSLQIYFDFSGYSDMAIGLAKMIGFDFLENFNYPYVSKSIREFWRRWHISLSSWFRDYLYIPLGGNRMGKIRNYLNLFFVFFLCGLWHGASWLFVIWGCWHGVFLVLERTFVGRFLNKINPAFQYMYTLAVLMIGWVFFRANSLSHASLFFRNMFGFNGLYLADSINFLNPKIIIVIILGFILSTPITKILKNRIKQFNYICNPIYINIIKGFYRLGLLLLFILCLVVLSNSAYNPFIYFRF
jgi:alginate O-acetyltransferase complex protein AlgI